jgi:hypothetical protein
MILFTLMMEAIRSSEPLVLTRATRRHITEDGIRPERSCPIKEFHRTYLAFATI